MLTKITHLLKNFCKRYKRILRVWSVSFGQGQEIWHSMVSSWRVSNINAVLTVVRTVCWPCKERHSSNGRLICDACGAEFDYSSSTTTNTTTSSTGTRPSVETVSGVCLKRICLLDTSAFSALEVPGDNCAL